MHEALTPGQCGCTFRQDQPGESFYLVRCAEHPEPPMRAPDLDTYACQRCGWRSGLDASCPDAMWERISAHAGGVNLLCLWCIDAIAAELGLAFSVSLHFAGRSVFGTSQSETDREHIGRLAAERDSLAVEVERLRVVGNR